MNSCSRARSTSRCISSGVAIAVVGLCGKDAITTRGKGSATSQRLLDAGEHVAVLDPRVHDGGAGEARRDQVDRVARARHDGAVAGLEQHPHQVREALLGADRADDVQVGVELHAEDLQVTLADRLAEVRQATARRVAMVRRLRRRLAQLFNRNLGRRDVGVAEAEVDHVAPVAPQLALQLVDRREDVGGEIVDSPEFQCRSPV